MKHIRLTNHIVDLWLLARLFYPLQPSDIRLVAVSRRDPS